AAFIAVLRDGRLARARRRLTADRTAARRKRSAQGPGLCDQRSERHWHCRDRDDCGTRRDGAQYSREFGSTAHVLKQETTMHRSVLASCFVVLMAGALVGAQIGPPPIDIIGVE